eukprot:1156484-Pelagomonas_calceolata.AAC.3
MAEPPLPEPPSAAEHAALEARLQAAQDKLEALQAEALNIQRYHLGAANYDFGPNNVFLALAGRCVCASTFLMFHKWRLRSASCGIPCFST